MRNFFKRILVHDPLKENAGFQMEGASFVDFPTLCKESDYITLHCPLEERTRHLFDEKAFSLMKETAFLVNTARGPVIKEDALIAALKENALPEPASMCLKNLSQRIMADVAPQPIHFIPGLKNMAGGITIDNVEGQDIMRGEETESIALLEWLPKGKEYLFVMPGSHTKFVTTDKDGRITGCLTSLAGEILSLLTTQSILADAVKHEFVTPENYYVEEMLAGFCTARKTSLSRVAFSTRIMNQFVAKHPSTCANFLLGAVLESDVTAVKQSGALSVSASTNVVVAGNDPMRTALVRAFEEDGYFEKVHAYIPPEGMVMSAYGAFVIARERGALKGLS